MENGLETEISTEEQADPVPPAFEFDSQEIRSLIFPTPVTVNVDLYEQGSRGFAC